MKKNILILITVSLLLVFFVSFNISVRHPYIATLKDSSKSVPHISSLFMEKPKKMNGNKTYVFSSPIGVLLLKLDGNIASIYKSSILG